MKKQARGRRRLGWTLIEVLVVLTIIGVLLSLLLPAVQWARESSRRFDCSNRLRSIGIALQGYLATHGCFPALTFGLRNSDDNSGTWRIISPFAQLLPQLERGVIFDLINFSCYGGHRGHDVKPVNWTAASFPIGGFLCPSDRPLPPPVQMRFGPPTFAGVNYRFCAGASHSLSDLGKPIEQKRKGAFNRFLALRPRDFSDGLSQTIGLSERLTGGADMDRLDPRRDSYLPDAIDEGYDLADVTAYVVNLCASPAADWPFHVFSGTTWMNANYWNTVYNHLQPPNSEWIDCSQEDGESPGMITARSLHSSGVNAVMMDGSVRFVGNPIDLEVWKAMATRQGGD